MENNKMNSWSDISIEKYVKLYNLAKEEEDEIEF
jgi:hypothetical protein